MLIVPDIVVRESVRQAVATSDDTVLEYASPAEALKALEVFQADCVVLAANFPTQDVFLTIRSIRKRLPKSRIITVNCFNEQEMRQATAEAGSNAFINAHDLSRIFLLASPDRLVSPSVVPVTMVPEKSPRKTARL